MAISATACGVALIALGIATQRPATAIDPQVYADAQKNQIEDLYASQRAAAPTANRPKDPIGAAPAPESVEPWPAGIFEDSEAPFPAAKYEILNRWQGDLGGRHLVVYAGALGSAPSHGVLVLQIYSPDLSSDVVREITPAGTSGILRVVAANGFRLTIQDAGGRRVAFDAGVTAGTP